MPSRLRRGAAGFWRGVKDVAEGVYRHDVIGLAAQISYSALFSLFPFLLFIRALLAYVPGTDTLGAWLLQGLADLVHADSRLYQIVENSIFSELTASSVTLLSVGIVLTLWSSSSAIMVLIKAVNRAYGLEEHRSWHRRRLTAGGLSIVGAVLIPSGVLLMIFGSWIGDVIARETGQGSVFHALWVGLRWPVVFVLLVVVLGAFYFFAPDARQRWYGAVPGSLFAVAGVMASSVGLSWFLGQDLFQVKWLTYGVIGTAIVLLFWGFLIGLMMLIGGEINGAVQKAVERRKTLPVEKESDSSLLESARDE